MFEPEHGQSLLPTPPRGEKILVINVGFDEESMDEMDRLLDTVGAKVLERVHAQVRKVNPATYIGEGKVEEIRALAEAHVPHAITFDVELTPNQLKNLEKALGRPTIDRAGVIIEIFSRHARTKEAKTQVELARLQYLLPRLAHYWTHFERQRGGGANQKGMGEKQIEVDRRLLKKRMSLLRDRLKKIESERNVQRSGRDDLLKVALVGYTNAGKSTLLNALTHSEVRAEDKLFATLDSSVRALSPDSHPPVVAIDTVGFIKHIPPSLVASFRSTLEELHQADLLVHVVDGSSAQAKEQLDVTVEVLKEMELDQKPRITVLNKMDLLPVDRRANLARVVMPGAVRVSAMNSTDVSQLREQILEHFKKNLKVWEIVIPYTESRIDAQIHEYGSIEVKRFLDKGTFYRLRIPEEWANKLNLKRFST